MVSLNTSVVHAAAITALVEATAGMICFTTPACLNRTGHFVKCNREKMKQAEKRSRSTLSQSVGHTANVILIGSLGRLLEDPLNVDRIIAIDVHAL